jgi:DinB superfamily
MMKPTIPQGWLDNYIKLVDGDDLNTALTAQLGSTLVFLENLTEDQWSHRYAPGKWSIKELAVHLMDTERIFAYRALRFARKDLTELPGYEENHFALHSYADKRSSASLIEEFKAVRECTVVTFVNLEPDSLDFMGTANGMQMSANGLGFAIVGHVSHHLRIVKERYLLML